MADTWLVRHKIENSSCHCRLRRIFTLFLSEKCAQAFGEHYCDEPKNWQSAVSTPNPNLLIQLSINQLSLIIFTLLSQKTTKLYTSATNLPTHVTGRDFKNFRSYFYIASNYNKYVPGDKNNNNKSTYPRILPTHR